MAKKDLVVLSSHEYWGEELIRPLEAVDPAGYEISSFDGTAGKKLWL
jgi:hypothetical protein